MTPPSPGSPAPGQPGEEARAGQDPSAPDGGAATTRWRALGGQFEIRRVPSGGASVLALDGELDIGTVTVLNEALGEVAGSGARVVLDLTRLAFGDSSMLAALLQHANRLRSQGGELRLAGARGPVLQVLEITGVAGELSLYDSVDQALAAAGDGSVDLGGEDRTPLG